MQNFQFSLNDINQTAANTGVGGSATSAQAASISDPDTIFDSGDSWDWYSGSPEINVQVDTNIVNQTAVNTALDGDAASAQAASINDPDALVDSGGGSPDFNFQISTNLINQTAVNTAIDPDGLFPF
ncbi:hypothetical protein [Microvirga sp. VF16]|uniref:hypothetical protein n=1 Tax=Microvirga sp. VF16 TaxID=2807101 RepID=UPI00193E85FA|nr:hypothetical protein [Microvirga sp. VF16]QRM29764.1 hypothetical protein JO965_01685 [Microvirga sp. VF16]